MGGEDEALSSMLGKVPRGTLLSEQERIQRLENAIPIILNCVEGEADEIAIESTLAHLLWAVLVQTNWCGFYRKVQPNLLKVGPYHGNQLGCLQIPLSKGICGACASLKQIQLVPDVTKRKEHIACDSLTKSELVIPITNKNGEIMGVLDLDSEHLNGFHTREAELLQGLMDTVFHGS
jgi:L-methionine (R)-S-oxide reductase